MLWIDCQACGYPTAHCDGYGRPLRLLRDAFGREVCISCHRAAVRR